MARKGDRGAAEIERVALAIEHHLDRRSGVSRSPGSGVGREGDDRIVRVGAQVARDAADAVGIDQRFVALDVDHRGAVPVARRPGDPVGAAGAVGGGHLDLAAEELDGARDALVVGQDDDPVEPAARGRRGGRRVRPSACRRADAAPCLAASGSHSGPEWRPRWRCPRRLPGGRWGDRRRSRGARLNLLRRAGRVKHGRSAGSPAPVLCYRRPLCRAGIPPPEDVPPGSVWPGRPLPSSFSPSPSSSSGTARPGSARTPTLRPGSGGTTTCAMFRRPASTRSRSSTSSRLRPRAEARILGDAEYLLWVNGARIGSNRYASGAHARPLPGRAPGSCRAAIAWSSSCAARPGPADSPSSFWRTGSSWCARTARGRSTRATGGASSAIAPCRPASVRGSWGEARSAAGALPNRDPCARPSRACWPLRSRSLRELFRIQAADAPWQPTGGRSRRPPSLGPLVEFDFGVERTGYLQLAYREGPGRRPEARSGAVLLAFGDEPIGEPPWSADDALPPDPGRRALSGFDRCAGFATSPSPACPGSSAPRSWRPPRRPGRRWRRGAESAAGILGVRPPPLKRAGGARSLARTRARGGPRCRERPLAPARAACGRPARLARDLLERAFARHHLQDLLRRDRREGPFGEHALDPWRAPAARCGAAAGAGAG